ncbi:MAG TPA: hypothetical protein VG675_06745 [Bryobacteraceae bacterium]|nr:hypothetical protein [Bryobacteraceae bacterium]
MSRFPRRAGVTALMFVAAASVALAQSTTSYLAIDGREVKPLAVRLKTEPSEIAASFAADRDGTYRFGIALSAAEISLLAPGMPSYTCSTLHEPLTLRYPYDWTWHAPKNGNVLNSRPRLVMPGLKTGGKLYIADTHELFSITLEPCGNGKTLRALLLAHRFFNDGGDRATADLKLRRGDKRVLTVQIYPDLATANRSRFGKHEVIQGSMTQPAYREWASEPLSHSGYELVGRKLQGVYQYIIVREVEAPSWIPEILHRHGMKAIHYQYMGALRRFSPQVTPAIQRQIGMQDKNGQLYTAPRPSGNWLLGDIRRPEVLARFVNNARMAVRAGFDGIFLDGYPFWNDTAGNIGGNVPGAQHSLAYARWLLLHEIKTAIREENPKATLGVLANQYFDSLGEADWTMRERMYFSWAGDEENRTGVKVRKDLDNSFEANEAPYSAGPLVYGAKGFDPMAVQSEIHFIQRPTGLLYTDASDFPEAKLEQWLDTVRSVFADKDLYLSDISPASCWITFPGLGVIRSDSRCRVAFSRPVCVADQSGRREGIRDLSVDPNVTYTISRDCLKTKEMAKSKEIAR